MVVEEKVASSLRCALEDLDYVTHQHPEAELYVKMVKIHINALVELLHLQAWM